MDQGCQIVYFQTKNPNLSIFWMVLQWKILVYIMAIWYILWQFGIFCGHLEYFNRFGTLYYEKSGNPATDREIESR
jgi:hypothetical protein